MVPERKKKKKKKNVNIDSITPVKNNIDNPDGFYVLDCPYVQPKEIQKNSEFDSFSKI